MSSTVVAVGEFPGLDLVSSPDRSACLDLLNVDLDRRGAVRSRDGYQNFTTSELTNQPAELHMSRDIGLFAGCGTRIEAIDTNGDVADSETGLTTGIWKFANFGTPATSAVYAGQGVDTLRKYTSAGGFTAPTATVDGVGGRAMPKGWVMAVQPSDNRLVTNAPSSAGGPHAAASSEHHVWFSSAGNAETWSTTDYVILAPGDGDRISAIVAWRDLLFVFKESAFFVFYGNSVDSTGAAVFNYRAVSAGVGAYYGTATAVAAPDGVYFINDRGVFRTTGGPPQRVSTPLDPLFQGKTASTYTGGTFRANSYLDTAALCWHNERLFVALRLDGATTNNRMLVWDAGQWLLWDVAAGSMVSWDIGDVDNAVMLFTYPAGANHIGVMGAGFTDDDDTPIASHYRTGFMDFGAPGIEKQVNEIRLWGTGTVNYKGSRDFGSLGTAEVVALGTAPAVDDVLIPGTTPAGMTYSFEIGADSGAWTVHNVVQQVDGRVLEHRTP